VDEAAYDSSPRAAPDVVALTRAMSRDDENAYREFHEHYVPRLLRYLLVVTHGDEHAAREALQLALIRVVRHVRVFDDDKIFWNWLTVLARSAAFDEARKRSRYRAFLDRFIRHCEPALAPAPDTDEQLSVTLARHVAALPSDERRLVEQKYFTRRSVREIAAELQTTEKAIESQLSRVRLKLKQLMLAALKNETSR